MPSWVLEPRDVKGVDPHNLHEVAFIGRASDNHVVLDSADVSRHHARIDVRDGVCRVVDLGSSNGTAVNGMPLKPRIPTNILANDLLQFGPFAFLLREDLPPTPPATPEAEVSDSPVIEATISAAAAAVAKLIIRAPSGTTEHLLSSDTIMLGRHPVNDIVVPDAIVSGRHARLLRQPTGYMIEDAGSSNGLWLSGQRIQQHTLGDGDVVMIGKTITIHYYDLGGPVEGGTVILSATALGYSAVGQSPPPPPSTPGLPPLPQ